jgi:hypothetical protein
MLPHPPRKPSKIVYKTVCLSPSSFFDEEVNRLLNTGWGLHGNPYSVGDGYCQALIKYIYEEAV